MDVRSDRPRHTLQTFWDLPPDRQIVVVYADAAGDWDALSGLILRLTLFHRRHVTYLTADPKDPVLEYAVRNVTPIFCGRGRARDRFFSRLDGSVVIMTERSIAGRPPAPSRSRFSKRVLAVTSLTSLNSRFDRKHLAGFDAILCAGPHHVSELATLVESDVLRLPYGASQLDHVIERRKRAKTSLEKRSKANVLLLPDGPEFLADCGNELIDGLLDRDHRVTLHLSHPTSALAKQARRVHRHFHRHPAFHWLQGPRPTGLLCSHTALVTDWSALAFDYALGLYRPVVFIDVPRRSGNAYGSADRRPFEIGMRRQVGEVVAPDRLGDVSRLLEVLEETRAIYQERLENLREKLVFHPGSSGAAGAEAIESIITGIDPAQALKRAVARISEESVEEQERYYDPVPDVLTEVQ